MNEYGVEYEISSLYPPRRYTEVYSCENNCRRCSKKCETGLAMYEIIYETVGA